MLLAESVDAIIQQAVSRQGSESLKDDVSVPAFEGGAGRRLDGSTGEDSVVKISAEAARGGLEHSLFLAIFA